MFRAFIVDTNTFQVFSISLKLSLFYISTIILTYLFNLKQFKIVLNLLSF